MKRTLLAALALSTFAGCTALPTAPAGTDSGPGQMTSSLVARAGTVLERFFNPQAAPQPQGADVHATAAAGEEEFRREHAKALAGDRDAMFRMAQMYRQGSNGVAQDEVRMVSWLRQASAQDHKVASYQLYLHYLDRGLDRQAVHYEKLALRQGYVIPPRLDPRRG